MAVAGIKKIPHAFTVKGLKFVIVEPDYYEDIASIVGIKKLADNEVGDYPTTFSQGAQAGALIHLVARLENNKTKTIVCTTALLSSALTTLKGKKFNKLKVKSVSLPRKRSRF